MSGSRPLRGGCQCGRNRYIIAVPEDGISEAQVLFNTEPHHQIPLATPLAAYIRVPLSWYHSTTYAFFPDETHSLIRRVYTHPTEDHAKRHFCGYCGTPLSYWSEEPRGEADFINLTLGSLLREDLQDLEDMGLIPEDDDDDAAEKEEVAEPAEQAVETTQGEAAAAVVAPTVPETTVLRQSFGVPWFEGLMEGTRLGNMRRSHGVKRSQDGQVKLEWEVIEYTEDADPDVEMETPQSGKRKLEETEQ